MGSFNPVEEIERHIKPNNLYVCVCVFVCV